MDIAPGIGLGTLVLFFTANKVNRPACNTANSGPYTGRWALDLSAPVGKAQYALLLAAQLAGKSVVVSGYGSCSLLSDSEDIYTIGYQ